MIACDLCFKPLPEPRPRQCPHCGANLVATPDEVRAMPIATNAYIGKQVVDSHVDKVVREMLSADEFLLGIFHGQAMSAESYGITGRYKGGLSLHDYLIVTNKRVIMWARGLLSGSTDGFHYEDIVSVEEARGLLWGEIVLNVRGAKERMRSMVREDVPKAAQLIREQIAAHKKLANSASQPTESIMDMLK